MHIITDYISRKINNAKYINIAKYINLDIRTPSTIISAVTSTRTSMSIQISTFIKNDQQVLEPRFTTKHQETLITKALEAPHQQNPEMLMRYTKATIAVCVLLVPLLHQKHSEAQHSPLVSDPKGRFCSAKLQGRFLYRRWTTKSQTTVII